MPVRLLEIWTREATETIDKEKECTLSALLPSIPPNKKGAFRLPKCLRMKMVGRTGFEPV